MNKNKCMGCAELGDELDRTQTNLDSAIEGGVILAEELSDLGEQLEQANQRIAELESGEVNLVLSEGYEGAVHVIGVFNSQEKLSEEFEKARKSWLDSIYTEPVTLNELNF